MSREIVESIVYFAVLACVLIGGCTSEFMADSDLEQFVEKKVLHNMSASEAVFVKSILLHPEPGTKGSVQWLKQNILEDCMPQKYTKNISQFVLVAFYYPSGQLPHDEQPPVIFANADLVQNTASTDEYIEWVTIARLSSGNYKSPKASCKFMFWFVNTTEKNGSEKFLEVSEEFELKNNQWYLSKVKTYPIRSK